MVPDSYPYSSSSKNGCFMPTKEEVEKSRGDRARFLCAVWDTQSKGEDYVSTDSTLASTAPDLDEAQAHRLVRSLIDDGVLGGTEMGLNDLTPRDVWLTAGGRREVEHWVTSGETTKHIPITHNQVFNNFHGPVNGSNIVTSSANFTINQVNNFGESIAALDQKVRQLLDEQNVVGDEREDVEADLATLSEQAGRTDPDTGRVRAALRSVKRWAGGVVATGTAAALQTEVTELAAQVLNQIAGG